MWDLKFFSRASAKAERDLSSLYGVFFVCRIGDPSPPPQIKEISDLYRFDLTKLTSPGQNFTGAYCNVTPILKKILITTDLT